jgi:hypothetical protein
MIAHERKLTINSGQVAGFAQIRPAVETGRPQLIRVAQKNRPAKLAGESNAESLFGFCRSGFWFW